MQGAVDLCASIAKRITPLAAWLITGVRTHWLGCEPAKRPRIYFANHNSHGDFILIWSCLPANLRALTRPIAGADYWMKSSFRKFVGCNVFNALLVERAPKGVNRHWMDPITSALEAGSSVIIFPEGTRNTTGNTLLPFKRGIHQLALACPDAELVPVWIENINRVLPKGDVLPVPLICSVTFGTPLHIGPDEPRGAFIQRAEKALLASAPGAGESI